MNEMEVHTMKCPECGKEMRDGSEHVQNNQSVRDTLGSRGIKPEELPPSEDIKKLERRVKSQEKKLVQESGKLPQTK